MRPELQLAKQLRSGNEEALFSLMTLYYNDLYKYGLKFTGDNNLTKDFIQQFIIHIWTNRRKFLVVENVKAYLVVAFKRYLLQELRKVPHYVSADLKLIEDPENTYEEYIILIQQEEQLRETLHTAIESLPPRQKELISLRYLEQLSFEEISLKTSLSLRTIYNKLHEALKKLRSHKLLEKFHNNMLN